MLKGRLNAGKLAFFGSSHRLVLLRNFFVGHRLIDFLENAFQKEKGPGVGPGPRNGLSGEQFWRNHICRTIEIHLLP
jgi:hypothetical protein